MILDTMTLEELILEIKTDFKEVRGRWNKFLPKFKKIIQKNDTEKNSIPLAMGYHHKNTEAQ